MTTINWIKCSEQMPPNDETLIILDHPDKLMFMTGSDVNILVPIWRKDNAVSKWTLYTKEDWRELNK